MASAHNIRLPKHPKAPLQSVQNQFYWAPPPSSIDSCQYHTVIVTRRELFPDQENVHPNQPWQLPLVTMPHLHKVQQKTVGSRFSNAYWFMNPQGKPRAQLPTDLKRRLWDALVVPQKHVHRLENCRTWLTSPVVKSKPQQQ
eukprot:m.212063 g.212063  ORF g.212063 m.212063 type:complete len:142 (-) comp15069_c0_seq1:2953-3378(-)